MTVAKNDSSNGGTLQINITGVTSTSNAGIGAFANPEGATLVILRCTYVQTTASTGSANLGIGVTTESAKGTDILNDLDVQSDGDGVAYNGHARQDTAKTQITAPALWTAAKFITFTGSSSTAGLTGKLLVDYVRL